MRPLALAAAALLAAARASAAPDPRFDGGAGLPGPSQSSEPAPKTPKAAEVDGRFWVVVAASDAKARSAAVNTGISIEQLRPGQASGIATAKALGRARAAGLKILSATPLQSYFSALDFPAEDKAYHTYDQTKAELQRIAVAAPDIASLFSIGKTLEGTRDIWALRLCPDAKGTAPSKFPAALFIGEHHAREHLSNEVPLLLAGRLVESRNDPEVAKLLASRDVYIIPMLNADGAEYDIAGDGGYRMHRKNTRKNADGSIGVDLNRNYGYHWGEGGASDDPNDETYRGPAPFSEPETQAVKAFIDARPSIKVLLTYHTYSELVLYPWGHTDAPLDDAAALKTYQTMAAEMGRMTGYTPEQSSALYIASGDLTDWSWGEHKIFSFTFEMTPKSMGAGGFYPGEAAIASSVQLNWRPMLYMIDLADDPRRVAESPSAAAFSFRPAPAAAAQ